MARTTCCRCCLIAAMLVTGAIAVAEESTELSTDVCVVGGGSGGIGAAVAAARAGAKVILVEREDRLGGTSVNAYVSSWEPGPGDTIAREIYDRLSRIPNAVGITTDTNFDRSKGPFGLWLITPGLRYEETLRRSGREREQWHAVVFDPGAFCKTVSEMLAETSRCRVLLKTSFVEAQAEGKRVLSIKAMSSNGSPYQIRARVFIDSTGEVHLCRALGCETMLGAESADRFGERFAPKEPGKTLNAISLCYRIHKCDRPTRQGEPNPPVKSWPRSAHITASPNGDLIVNPLAMQPGEALFDTGYEKTMAACKPIVQAQWRWLQSYPALAGYEFHSFAPVLGIREGYRVVGEYVLTQHDLEAGLKKQTHSDIIAVADHSMDVHGAGQQSVHGELKGLYGITYRCLIPKGWENLLVACRGASFSHIAASSCRLSRTIIALGHAAGTGAAMAAKADVPVYRIDVAALQRELDMPPNLP